MHIGVEASTLRGVSAGIARYTLAMVSCILELAPDAEFTFYSPRPFNLQLPASRCRLRTGSGLYARYANLWLQERLPTWLAEDHVDVFWGQNHLLPLRLKRPCRRLLTVHDLTALLFPSTMPFRSALAARYLLRKVARAADFVAADSHATANLVERCLGVERGKLAVVHNGVGECFTPIPRAAAGEFVTREYGLPRGFMLTVGTIEPRKNHMTLLDAVESEARAPLLVVVGGEGWRCAETMRRVRKLEAEGRVRYLGWVDDSRLAVLYSAATLMVYPSYYEGFGLPVLEAMACGCPVLCSWSSSLPEVGGDAVRYFRPRDREGLVRQLRMLTSSPDELAAMSSRGLRRAGQFGQRAAASRMLTLMCNCKSGSGER
jgi:glycosyltransferase involved in cell wall biosynthesis